MPLPTLAALVEPKGAGGAVPGFAVPLDDARGKAALAEPVQRGAYGIASLDRKTVLKMLVVSKEEAGFDPVAAAASMAGQLASDVQDRIRATWTLLQFTFESHDPGVTPAVGFLLDVARRAGELTEGVVGDPLSRRYVLPESLPHLVDKISADVVCAVHSRTATDGMAVCTLGMQKFGLPEFEVSGISEENVGPAGNLALGAAQRVLDHGPVSPGDVLGVPGAHFRVAVGGLDRGFWDGIACYDLVSEEVAGTDAALQAWKESTGHDG
ncbi:MAG: hypothetical protein JSS65_07980 [Armatimonadetes bacterium]|nr:hypothetical protein [Armatimonadota bacterium]